MSRTGTWALAIVMTVVAGQAYGVGCGADGLAVTVALDAGRGPAVRGATLDITYPSDRVHLPGSDPAALQGVIDNVFDGDGSHGSLLVATNHPEPHGAHMTVLYTATSDLPSRPDGIVRVRFSCRPGTSVQAEDFRCVARDAVGEAGGSRTGVSCALLAVTPVGNGR